MGCGTCTTRFRAGDTSSSCSSGSCDINGVNKLQVFDWLTNIDLPADEVIHEYVEIRFKNSRKEIFSNSNGLPFFVGDTVVVEGKPGYDIGVVSLTGRLVSFQLKRKRQFKGSYEFIKVLRKASQEEINKWEDGMKMEEPTMLRTRELARTLGLVMKVSDVEYQADKSKAIFYYTADERVDFRELIKKIADEFRIRVEMKQIGSRQEASRLGGIASCGRELCCSTWLTDFRSVSTSAARYQQLSLNPQKLTGQCGKLKCCLNYELDMYMENLKDLPNSNVVLESEQGTAVHFKTDIFKKEVWYVLRGKEVTSPFKLKAEQVFEVLEMNKNGKKPFSFLDLIEIEVPDEKPEYSNVVGQDDLNRFDDKKSNKKKRKSSGQWRKKRSGGNNNPQGKNTNKSNQPQAKNRNKNTQRNKSDKPQKKK